MVSFRKIFQVVESLNHKLFSLLLATAIVGCATLAPIAMEIARNLLVTAAYNHKPEYAESVETLLIALATERKPAVAEMAAMQPFQESTVSDYAMPEESYQERGLVAVELNDSAEPIVLDVALLAQRMSPEGRMEPEPIADGASLRDGGSDPAAGDTLKITFSANCECYIYIVAIDASGYVELAFPNHNQAHTNPVRRGQQYSIPEGSVWYGLDEVRGTETIYFVASHTRRTDLEQVYEQLSKTKRTTKSDYRSVTQPAIIPRTRGLTKVDLGASMTVPIESGERFVVTPDTFTSTISGADFVITRWFHHVSNE